jgi:predicted AAA+ superfamily ATPase
VQIFHDVEDLQMIPRRELAAVADGLGRQAAVALLGPRQVGKTTLALELAGSRPSVYLDLETATDRAKLTDPALFFAAHEHELVILDEIQRVPELFATLRGVIDRGRRAGRRTGRFLLLGSASLELLRQSSESLAGRIAHVELAPFDVTELRARDPVERLWLRGGFPDSFLATDDRASRAWRADFIRTYLERDIPLLGPRVPAETLRRFWTMLAHEQGGMINASKLAAGLSISGQTVARYTDLLVDLLLVRRLSPLLPNVGKRLVKTPRVFVRDSGLVHALLGLETLDDLLGHPVVGPSWEGFVVENLLSTAPPDTTAGFYRTATGVEVDLVLDLPDGERWAIEVKRTASLERGFHVARADLEPDRCFVVHAGSDRYPIAAGVDAIGLRELAAELAARRR